MTTPDCAPQLGLPAFLSTEWTGNSCARGTDAVARKGKIDTGLYRLTKTVRFAAETKPRFIADHCCWYGSWHMIGLHPELFAAAIPFCGEDDPGQAEKMNSVSIWAFHWAKDVNVSVSSSRDMVSALKKAGGSPRHTEYPNEGHDTWE